VSVHLPMHEKPLTQPTVWRSPPPATLSTHDRDSAESRQGSPVCDSLSAAPMLSAPLVQHVDAAGKTFTSRKRSTVSTFANPVSWAFHDHHLKCSSLRAAGD